MTSRAEALFVQLRARSLPQGVAIREQIARLDPASTSFQRNLPISHNKLGDLAAAV